MRKTNQDAIATRLRVLLRDVTNAKRDFASNPHSINLACDVIEIHLQAIRAHLKDSNQS